MSCLRSYYTAIYCHNGDPDPIVEDCEYLDALDDEGIKSSCQIYSADFVIITEYKGIDPVFRIVFDYQPAELVARVCRHYVTRGSDYASL
nr:MAG TPA: hypothetical protein [Caudoviricetes sp.]